MMQMEGVDRINPTKSYETWNFGNIDKPLILEIQSLA